jgi:olefin beta-lactone synthetase
VDLSARTLPAGQDRRAARSLFRRHHAVDLVAFPVFVIVNLGLGVTSVLPMRENSAKALFAWLIGNRVTRILAPPSLCEIIVANSSPPDLSTVFTGGGPVFPDLLSKLCERLPKAEIVTVYGSTEAEPIAHQTAADLSAADWQAMRSGAGLVAGPPVAGLQMRLIDDEIVVTGAHVNKGYLGGLGDAENKPVIDGEVWHRTGDAGRLDDRGRLWLLGRRGAAAGGLYPFQIEAAARLWPGVRRVALVPGSMPPLLAIEGDAAQAALWRREAARFDGLRVVDTNVPLDRRHRSKVDYVELERRIGKLRQVN